MRKILIVVIILICSSAKATITISNTQGKRAEIFEYLKKISNDNLMIDDNGVVSYPTHWYDFFVSSSHGRRLIRALVDSSHNVDIAAGAQSITHYLNCDHATIVSSSNGAVIPGQGSGAVIHIYLGSSDERTLVFNNVLAPNTLGDEISSTTYVLAHEMIHALHGVSGLRIPHSATPFTNSGDIHVPNTFWGLGDLGYYHVSEIINLEEAITVGFSHADTAVDLEYPGYSNVPLVDITENSIREELGGALRGLYASRSAFQVPRSQYYVSASWRNLGSREIDATTGGCDTAASKVSVIVKTNAQRQEETELSSFHLKVLEDELVIKGILGIEKVMIHNMIGQSYELKEINSRIDISKLSSGVYILNLKTKEGKKIRKKFMKKN